MGGLLSSTVLTLLVLPTYYELLDDLTNWMKRVWWNTRPVSSSKEPEPAGAGD